MLLLVGRRGGPGPQGGSGTVLSAAPFTIACGEGALRIRTAQLETGVFMTGDQLAAEARIVPNMVFGANPKKLREQGRKKSVLILGVNGFIGSHLSERLLDSGKYEVYGLDLRSNYIDHLLGREGFHFREGDISIHREWIEYHTANATSSCRWSPSRRRSSTPAIRCASSNLTSRRICGSCVIA